MYLHSECYFRLRSPTLQNFVEHNRHVAGMEPILGEPNHPVLRDHGGRSGAHPIGAPNSLRHPRLVGIVGQVVGQQNGVRMSFLFDFFRYFLLRFVRQRLFDGAPIVHLDRPGIEVGVGSDGVRLGAHQVNEREEIVVPRNQAGLVPKGALVEGVGIAQSLVRRARVHSPDQDHRFLLQSGLKIEWFAFQGMQGEIHGDRPGFQQHRGTLAVGALDAVQLIEIFAGKVEAVRFQLGGRPNLGRGSEIIDREKRE
mmetsp:Transcript_11742/g.17516  ORF Transcript_11742/g.17516 Transcript_11742/m.17516 type:complete len:254 (+) Transcript_11742:100-861(+)